MMLQLLLHLIGDYITQSHWMASEKTKRFWPAFIHAVVYSMPFQLLGPSWKAFLVILVTHFLIDRYRLARIVVWLKNVLGDPRFWSCNPKARYQMYGSYWTGTGYPEAVPPWMSVWLLIAADNTLHLAINYLTLRYL